jgi:gliding motility-associated-like protein
MKIDTVVITQPTPLTSTSTSSNVPCLEVCNGVATATVFGGVPGYSYDWNNGQITNPATNLCEGIYYVTITDLNGCHTYDTVVVHDSTTFPAMINAWADDDTIYSSQSTGIHVTHVAGASYLWSPPNGLSSTTVPDPTASPTVTTTYIIAIQDVYGCVIFDTVTIYVLEVNCDEHGIYVPNAFTPNGDNNNDVLYVRSNVISKIYFTIYDRWGEMVFETNDINKGWDGTFRGKQCDPGVFVYYLEVTCIDDQKNLRKGNITLIR